MTGHACRLRWERGVSRHDPFAIRLLNPDALDTCELARRAERIRHSRGAGGNKAIDQAVMQDLSRWAANPVEALPFRAYAKVADWFLTRKDNDRKSELGLACKLLWDFLFMAVPPERLTNPHRPGAAMTQPLDRWWRTQAAWQAHEV